MLIVGPRLTIKDCPEMYHEADASLFSECASYGRCALVYAALDPFMVGLNWMVFVTISTFPVFHLSKQCFPRSMSECDTQSLKERDGSCGLYWNDCVTLRCSEQLEQRLK